MLVPARSRPSFVLVAALLLSACAHAPSPVRHDPPQAYLSVEATPRMTDILPPAPSPGSARYEADRQVFRATRALEGSPRWQLATADVDGSIEATLADFSCAAGATLDAAHAPRLSHLLARLEYDVEQATAPAKQAWRRLRPFQIDPGPVCQPTDRLARSFDYPSGHATWGWTVGMLLAELAPDRASGLLQRGRAYADSRVVCGAHNLSAIGAGALTAAALLPALQASPAFREDMASAREELIRLRQSPDRPAAARCEAERALTAPVPY
jgi:acid phosphatase (class A)